MSTTELTHLMPQQNFALKSGHNTSNPEDQRLYALVQGILRLLIGLFGMPSNGLLAIITWRHR
jgi:hypothetical protein